MAEAWSPSKRRWRRHIWECCENLKTVRLSYFYCYYLQQSIYFKCQIVYHPQKSMNMIHILVWIVSFCSFDVVARVQNWCTTFPINQIFWMHIELSLENVLVVVIKFWYIDYYFCPSKLILKFLHSNICPILWVSNRFIA